MVRGLDGSRVLVSGGTRGIGYATARRFLEEGAVVHVCGPDGADVDAAVEALSGFGEIGGSECDVSDAESVARLVDDCRRRWDRIDVLINNAGISWREPFLEITPQHWDAIIAVNLRGMFLAGQAVARLMVDTGGGGSIVNMASTNGLAGEADYAHYNASKGGVVLLTKTMAVELAAHRIRVNALCPGYIDTPLNRQIVVDLDDPTFVDRYVESSIPIGRPGREDDVAAAYAFLASSDASFITGTTLVVDGGQTAMM
jgi:NAD(P)-dependent dehydrogenase (short-subunit alcohol dehydrogenase family)